MTLSGNEMLQFANEAKVKYVGDDDDFIEEYKQVKDLSLDVLSLEPMRIRMFYLEFFYWDGEDWEGEYDNETPAPVSVIA